jgi:hypothetical protein
MLTDACLTLCLALLIGSALAVLYLRSGRVPVPAAALHGLIGLAGFLWLLLALRGPPRGLATGTSSFGAVAAVLIAFAALAGGTILAAHRLKPRLAGTLIGVHATLAVSGVVILAAYLLAG